MSLKNILMRFIYPNRYSSEAFCKYLRSKGCEVGKNTYFFNPISTEVDVNRGKFIEIGDNCKIAAGVIIVAHDYSWEVVRKTYHEILPNGGKKIKIGNNVFIGKNAIIMRGVEIGDNCIIGAGSVVTKSVPSNTVCAGNPAHVITSLEEYYKKNKDNLIENAAYDFKVFYDKMHRVPEISETGHFMVLFLERNDENLNNYFSKLTFKGDDRKEVIEDFMNTKPVFKNYEEYVEFMKNKFEIK